MLKGEKEVEAAGPQEQGWDRRRGLLPSLLFSGRLSLLYFIGEDNLSKKWRLILPPKEDLNKTFY